MTAEISPEIERVSEFGVANLSVYEKILASKAVADAYILEDHLIPGED